MNYEWMMALQSGAFQGGAAYMPQMPVIAVPQGFQAMQSVQAFQGLQMQPQFVQVSTMGPTMGPVSVPFFGRSTGGSSLQSDVGSGSSADGVESVEDGGLRKVVVFDPINKQPYSLTYGEGGEIHPTAGLELHLSSNGANKRAFLCKKYQARQCRAQSKCNSIHADRKRITQLRAENPTDKSVPVEVTVYHPTEDETFSVPTERILKTEGYHKHVAGPNARPKDPTGKRLVCVKHESEGCDGACGDIHIDVAYLRHVRSMWKSPCCSQASCGCDADAASRLPLLSGSREWKNFKIIDGGKGAAWPKAMITYTKGLKDLCEEEHTDTLIIPMTRVCRPHQKKACKWGLDCSNVHICRKKLPAGHPRPRKDMTPPPAARHEMTYQQVHEQAPVPPVPVTIMTPEVATTGANADALSSMLLGFQGAFKAGN
eukprot:TRINITY_DN598_c0_g12_i1.p1 TRINITY_DN598_c0_g12~~TRINITY_DN598_c0_g12_i1.p1  ORF type:complete len:428 (+),score=120.05 TRINITY_DN598_c0_g12_i1:55-1338(+)